MTHTETTTHTDNLTIRFAGSSDRDALLRLAQLDSTVEPHEGAHVLVAEVGGEIAAALPGGGDPIANPFRRTAGLVTLLEARAAEIAASKRAPRRRRLGVLRSSPAGSS